MLFYLIPHGKISLKSKEHLEFTYLPFQAVLSSMHWKVFCLDPLSYHNHLCNEIIFLTQWINLKGIKGIAKNRTSIDEYHFIPILPALYESHLPLHLVAWKIS